MSESELTWWQRNWRKATMLGCLAGLLIMGAAVMVTQRIYRGANANFQDDADVYRLHHLEYYNSLVEEYQKATGKYPLQGQHEVPTYVFMAHSEQLQSPPPGPPYEHQVVPFADFVTELEAGLGRAINERYDPQLRAMDKPNFYLYMITGETYFLAVHVHGALPFAKRIADGYFKVEVSNGANEQNEALNATFFNSAAFQAELKRPLKSPAFFAERERIYLHQTKQKSDSP